MKYLMRLIVCGSGLLLAGCAHRLPQKPAARPFDFQTDRLAYVNETVWRYKNGKPYQAPAGRRADEKYSRRCFVVSRSALQFWKFARFEPSAPPLPDRLLAERVRDLARIDVWRDPYPPQKRIVFPGYAGLHALSAARPEVLQANMGAGWTIYLRPGNTPMVFPPGRGHQQRTYEEIRRFLSLNYPAIIWMVTFPSLALNHSVLVYDVKETGAQAVFKVYDPNITTAPQKLVYDKASRSFSYNPTFYFAGVAVDVRTIYWSPGQ